MTYEAAVREIKRVGVGRVEGLPHLAVTIQTLCLVHRGISAKMAYEGAVKKGLTATQVRNLSPSELSDLMWV